MKELPAKRPSLWQRIVKAFYRVEEQPERPAHGANWAKPQGQMNPYPAKISMSAFASHGYVFAAVSRASQDLAALPLKLIKGKGKNATIIEDHPFLDLMEQPSSYMDGFSLREQLLVDLMLTGGCYCLLAGSNQEPTSLFRLHPEQTRIITDQLVGIKGFEYTDSGSTVEYPIERVVFVQSASWHSGVESLYGLGGIQPLQKEIGADLSAQKLASDSARKGRPDILISPADEADIWDSDQRRAILDAYRGMSSEGGAMVLSGQVKIEPLQISPRDLEFQAVRTYAREAISAVFGVPPSILGAGDLNYAVSRQQAQNYWEVQTKRGKKMSHLFSQIAKRFDPSFRVEIDYSGVEALQEVRNGQIDRISKHILNGMNVADAYNYEGLEDAPVIPEDQRESEAEDIGDEDGQNVRIFDALLRSMIRAEVDLGKKSNAKEAMEALPESTQKALKKKSTEHNEEYGDKPAKRLTNGNYLAVSYHRGLAAYNSSPESVRPSVSSAAQWAMGRVNGLLYALRTGKFRRKPYDTDLLPKEHPLKDAEDDKEQKHLIFGWKELELAEKSSDWGFTKREARQILGDDDDMDRYKKAFLFVNRGGSSDPGAYRLPIAKIIDGTLKIVFRGVIAAGSSVRGEPKFGAGYYNLSGATQRDKERLYDEIEDLYARFGEQAPTPPWKKEQKKDVTNFPKAGDDKKISLRNSEYRAFDVDYAEDLKENWPSIWKKGGNIEGNNQYRRLLPIVKRADKSAQTDTEEMAIKKREAWAARHLADFRLAGTVAQIKWFVIGERGQSYMKELINKEKKRLSDKKARERSWLKWLEKRHQPAERKLQRSMYLYLQSAKKRYKRRLKEFVNAEKMNDDYIIKSVLSWSELLAVGEEVNKLIQEFGPTWLGVWAASGNEELDRVFERAQRTRPLDLVFGERNIAQNSIDLAAFQMAQTTARNVKGIIEQGLLAGASIRQIAIGLDNSTGFGIARSRMIARTEATKAINLASNQSYQTAANEGIRIEKEWLSSRDDKVRETHVELDGQIVGVNDDFIVPSTGEKGSAPGAFAAASESINCRCTIIPVIND
tara:strand:- start:1499 stop:4693 length:3195 start_codon:yes stop_codon:yes gene_type:complete